MTLKSPRIIQVPTAGTSYNRHRCNAKDGFIVDGTTFNMPEKDMYDLK